MVVIAQYRGRDLVGLGWETAARRRGGRDCIRLRVRCNDGTDDGLAAAGGGLGGGSSPCFVEEAVLSTAARLVWVALCDWGGRGFPPLSFLFLFQRHSGDKGCGR
ncbi:LysR family transcriptional regulator [Sesbania bispinosa]|nr:LysR family transcriptional regulator [Sesbania bispinosa]